jgi:hypothetical protein
MATLKQSTTCPVCGYDLGFQPWNGESPSDEICPCCGMQFGYYDATPEGSEGRLRIYAEWRQRWIAEGMAWNSTGQAPPTGWNPVEQLKTVHLDT